jgi:mono/diheme cytochrome c family protein
VQCHGTSGDGLGPAAALLAPYPRDFRRGSFKFKSTPIGRKPTHADLVRTLESGLPGTAMPAFGALNHAIEFSEDIDALAHYVRFLSIRGEVERRLISAMTIEIASNDLSNPQENDAAKQATIDAAKFVVSKWEQAEASAVQPPSLSKDYSTEERAAAIERGKVIFASELTACSKCHGKAGDGNGSQDFDDWTKDWTIRAGIDPTKREEWKPRKKFGALKPVIDPSRNFKLGVFRGGATREDIYLRIVNGIEGSPMPAVARKENLNPGVTEEDIADVIEYVLSLTEEAGNVRGN